MSTQNIFISEVKILNNLIIEPFNAMPLLVLHGGYISIIIKIINTVVYISN